MKQKEKTCRISIRMPLSQMKPEADFHSSIILKSFYFRLQYYICCRIAGVMILVIPSVLSAQSAVTIKEADEIIPTYISGAPEPNPMFFFKKESQGAEGRIYPYPLYDNLTNKKGEKSYHLIYLENEYVKIGILPEIGGRVFSALDKTNNYDFVYRQHVIKPALIGLIGSWISGGIEWNIPHHHRASTFLPVQWSREEHSDGSKTIWVGELEMRHRMTWAVGYTLRPGSSILECSIRIINRTPLVNTMLAFANVAVHVDESYQVIFPPSTEWVTGHSKRDFYSWPNVDGGADMSWYKNNAQSASWFAINKKEDFVAGYNHGLDAGIMTIADRNVVPGKKFFTWGVGNMWDKILTDDDGPYLEIMVGAYSDNQPDYSWLQPFEERTVEMAWYPFRGINGAKMANKEAVINLEVKDGRAAWGFYTTRAYQKATVSLKAGSKLLSEEEISINPGKPYRNEINLPADINEYDLKAAITVDGKELAVYSPSKIEKTPKPVPTASPLKPADIKNDEELFLAGQRIDQFHNPTRDADPYWEEVLRRDPGNTAANIGMGILNLRKAKFEAAEQYLNKAIDRLTFQYTTPKNAEPLYYLGISLKAQGRLDEAYTAFYKAAWSQEWKSPAYFSLSEIAALKGSFQDALKFADQSIDANALNVRAYGLKASILRLLGRNDEALSLIVMAMAKTDPLDVRLMSEKWLLSKQEEDAVVLAETLNDYPQTGQEVASEYYNAGLWKDGLSVLDYAVNSCKDAARINPLIFYYLGYFSEKLGENAKAAVYRKKAALQSSEYVFPFQEEEIAVLKSAVKANPKDAKALYYLGNLLYDWQPDQAIKFWEESAAIDSKSAITWRNLAVGYSHQQNANSLKKAISSLEKAVSLPNPYPRHFAELDKFYQTAGESVQKRLNLLEKHQKIVLKNDEALSSLITLKIFTGKSDEAIGLLAGRTFSIWEGGNSFNTGQAWADAHLVRGLQLFNSKKYREAIRDFETVSKPGENLRAEQRYNRHSSQTDYLIGCAYDKIGESKKAQQFWSKAVLNKEPESAKGQSVIQREDDYIVSWEERYYQALAKKKLGRDKDAEAIFNELIAAGKTEAADTAADKGYQSVRESGRKPDQPKADAAAHYGAGLGYQGLGDMSRAGKEFTAALVIMPDNLNIKLALNQL